MTGQIQVEPAVPYRLAGAGRQGQQTVSCGRAWSGQGRRALRGFV